MTEQSDNLPTILCVGIPKLLYRDAVYTAGTAGFNVRLTEVLHFVASNRREGFPLRPLPANRSKEYLILELPQSLHKKLTKQASKFGITTHQLVIIAIQKLAYPDDWRFFECNSIQFL